MELKDHLRKEYTILTSLCDFEGMLGIRNTFDMFMDLASEHAAQLGVSYYDMLEHHCYWVAVRTRVRLYERPRLGDMITALTWPGKPGLAKSDRFYRMEMNSRILAEGRTEWAAQDIDTGAVRRTDSYGYPMELRHREERVCAEPFTRFRFMEQEPGDSILPYQVSSMDIDVGRHMNNVAYIRMLLGVFSTAEQAAMDVSEMEISYRQACFEGERLEILRRPGPEGWLFQVKKENGEAAAHARIVLR